MSNQRERIINRSEENLRGEVIKENGQWIARLDEKGCLVLPDGLGRMMHLALKMEKTRRKDWRPNKIASTICQKFNCHKLTFFLLSTVLGNQELQQLWQKAKKMVYNDRVGVFLEIGPTDRIKVDSFTGLKKVIKDKLDDNKENDNQNNLVLLQIWKNVEQGDYLMHSCLAGIDTINRVVCLEKVGLGLEKIQCVSLKNIIQHYEEIYSLGIEEIIWGIKVVDEVSIEIAKMEMVLMENLRRVDNVYFKNVFHYNLKMTQRILGNVSVNELLGFLTEPDGEWATVTFNILEYLLDKGLIRRDELISQVLLKINQFDLSDMKEYMDIF